jgi:hypothetical protein
VPRMRKERASRGFNQVAAAPRVSRIRIAWLLSAVQSLGSAHRRGYVRAVCGRVRLSSDVSEIKLVFSIPPHRPTPNIAPSWNVAPTDPPPVVRYDAKAGESSLEVLRRGLVLGEGHQSRLFQRSDPQLCLPTGG